MNSFLRVVLASLLIVGSTAAFGQRVAERYERLLIPVLPVGSWPADLWIRNEGTEPVDLFPLVRDADSPSRGQYIPLFEPGVPAQQTLEYRVVFSPFPLPYYMPLTPTYAGGVLYVERGKRQNVRFQLRVGDAQIPTVPEDEFVATPLSLLRMNIVEGKRYTLRVYSLDNDHADVTVTFEPEVGGPSIPSQSLRLERPPAAVRCASPPCPWPDVPFTPAWAATFFDAALVPPWTYRITATPPPGTRIWMFLSETDVATRAIRIYTPN